MFALSKINAKVEIANKKKKNNSNSLDKNKQLKKNNSQSHGSTSDKEFANAKRRNTSDKYCSGDDMYSLHYRRESDFFAQESDECSEILSTINSTLQNSQSRSSCFPMLEIAIDGCNSVKLSQNINHWASSLMNIFLTSSSMLEKEMACNLLIKIIPNMRATQETNQFLTTLTNHLIGKSINEEVTKNDPHLLLKMTILKECLYNLPSLCGQHKGKYDKFFHLLIDHKHFGVQELAAQCLAMVPCTGGVGSSGQAHQEGWSAALDKILLELENTISSIQTELTAKSSGGNYFFLAHKVSGMVKTLIALLMQPNVKHFESKNIFDIIDQMLNIKMISGPSKPYILQLHQLAFAILETLLSRYCELLSFKSTIIFNHINQVLRDTSRKMPDEKSKFCTLRKSVYVCLKLCFIHNIFPFSMTPLNSVIKAAVKDCIFPIVIADSSTSISNKMKLSISSKEAYVKKKNKKQYLDVILDDVLRNGAKSRDEEVGMCVAALEALNCFVSSDSKLLQLSVLTEDKSIYPLVASEESKQETIMTTMITPIWRFIIPQVRKLQGLWNINPVLVASSSLGIYDSVEVKRALYQVLSSLISLPFLRNTEAFNAACQLVRMGAHSKSEVEVQRICKQTLQWLNFMLDNSRHLKAPSSNSVATVNDIPFDAEKEEEELPVPCFKEVLLKENEDKTPEDDTETNIEEMNDGEVEDVNGDDNEEIVEDETTCGDDDDNGVDDDECVKTFRDQHCIEENLSKVEGNDDIKPEASSPTGVQKRKLDGVDDNKNDHCDVKRCKIDGTFLNDPIPKNELEIVMPHITSKEKEFYESTSMNFINMEFDSTWR